MRITRDKNGDPFGYCESTCNQQMRVGGNAHRVGLFMKRYPWAAGQTAEPKAPVSVTEPKEAQKQEQETKQSSAPKGGSLGEALAAWGFK